MSFRTFVNSLSVAKQHWSQFCLYFVAWKLQKYLFIILLLAQMENYLLYEEILRNSRAISFKGRRKKTLTFLCIQQYSRKDLEYITDEVCL